jgi:alpha-D-xyloside xylohydrolase
LIFTACTICNLQTCIHRHLKLTQAIVPYFSSSAGYGILWDSTSKSVLNAPLPGTPPFLVLSTAFWGLGTGAGAEGTLVAQQTGTYVFYAELCGDYGCSKQAGNAFNSIEVTCSDVDDPSGHVFVIQNWAQLSNLPNALSGKVSLQQGHTYHIKFSGNIDNGRLFVIEPSRNTFSLSSRHSSFIDYYVTWSGQESLTSPLDSAVRGYRSITGDVPPYALWAYGFWQCKEHYATQAELLNASATFRSLGIPVDNIVQDWHYWGDLGWGPQWDSKLYPDPAGMVAQLHKQNFHFMISVWSRFDNSTTFYAQMRDIKALVGRSDYYGSNVGLRGLTFRNTC